MSEPSAGAAVRPAGIDDAAGIAAIYNHHIDRGGATFDVTHWSVESIEPLLRRDPPDGWFVAQRDTPPQDTSLIGWASVRRFSERAGFRHACETAIYLTDEAIGTGVADQLQARVERHCRQHRLHHAVAKVIADNHRSLRFHYRHGYEQVGVQREIGWLQGRWVDLVILQRLFDIT